MGRRERGGGDGIRQEEGKGKGERIEASHQVVVAHIRMAVELMT